MPRTDRRAARPRSLVLRWRGTSRPLAGTTGTSPGRRYGPGTTPRRHSGTSTSRCSTGTGTPERSACRRFHAAIARGTSPLRGPEPRSAASSSSRRSKLASPHTSKRCARPSNVAVRRSRPSRPAGGSRRCPRPPAAAVGHPRSRRGLALTCWRWTSSRTPRGPGGLSASSSPGAPPAGCPWSSGHSPSIPRTATGSTPACACGPLPRGDAMAKACSCWSCGRSCCSPDLLELAADLDPRPRGGSSRCRSLGGSAGAAIDSASVHVCEGRGRP